MEMKTNDIFDLRRFGKYFASDIRTCCANYGLSLLTISVLLPFIVYVIPTALNLILKSSWDGPDTGLRFFIFVMAMFCIIVTMPVKCYGKITEKQYGTFWLTLPSSKLEKFISMIIMTCIIAPITGVVLYLGMDALICALDHSCGNSLIAGAIEWLKNLGNLKEVTVNLVDEHLEIENAAMAQEIVKQLSSPLLYIDEIFCLTLPFLLGAIFFKNGKTVKTFLVLFAFSTAVSIAMTPVMTSWTNDILTNLGNSDDKALITSLFGSGLFKHMVLIDTISDTMMNAALLAGIWFRIKTLKH